MAGNVFNWYSCAVMSAVIAMGTRDDPGCPTVTKIMCGIADNHSTAAEHAQKASVGLSVVRLKATSATSSPFLLLGIPGTGGRGSKGRHNMRGRRTVGDAVIGGIPRIAPAFCGAHSGTHRDLPVRLYDSTDACRSGGTISKYFTK